MAQDQVHEFVGQTSLRSGLKQLGPSALQQLSILNSGGTHLLAGATAKAAIDVPFKGNGIALELALFEGAHQIDASAWAVVLVTRQDVGGTSFEAKTTVNAGEEFLLLRSEC